MAFALGFYESLFKGRTLGNAMMEVRHANGNGSKRIEQQLKPIDPTWIAYSLYGDPTASVAVGTTTTASA